MEISRGKLFLTTLLVGALYPITQYLVIFNYHYNFTTQLDILIPFVPWTVVIYLLHLPLLFLGPLLINNDKTFTRVCLSLILSFLAASVVFAALPSSYPRPLVHQTGIFNTLVSYVQLVDQPSNTFPSLHVTVAMIVAAGIMKDWNRKDKHIFFRISAYIIYITAILISLSILTVKQHYVVDLVGGFMLYLIAWKTTKPFVTNLFS